MNTNTLKAAASVATAVLVMHHNYFHSLPATYNRMAPSVAMVKSIGSMRNPYNVNGDRIHDIKGVGTGFVINHKDKRHIVTNYHIVSESEEILVAFDKIKYKTSIEYADPIKDVALLAVPDDFDHLLKPLELCTDPVIGEAVIAIGNPYGLEKSVSSGIISGIERDNGSQNNLIQTDASINPGNSGGPLVSLGHSCVLGMTTSIISPSGAFAGIGLAIPADELTRESTELQSISLLIQ